MMIAFIPFLPLASNPRQVFAFHFILTTTTLGGSELHALLIPSSLCVLMNLAWTDPCFFTKPVTLIFQTNVLTELRKWKLHFIEHHTLEMRQEREKHAAHVRQLTNQMENLKELLHTYEISIGRKDEVIANLTHAIEKQKDRIQLMKTFTKWRLQHFVGRQEVYTKRLADRLYEMGLLKKAWTIWRSRIHIKWKETMERACQSSAESVRIEISSDYETKLQEVNAELEAARAEMLEMQNRRHDYEDAMKKAFMRGVCALNLEAMTIFQGKEFRFDQADLPDKRAEPGAGTGDPTPKLPPTQFDRPLPPTSSSSLLPPPPPPPPPPPAMTSGSAAVENLVKFVFCLLQSTRVVTSAQQKAGKTITARITGRSDFGPKNRIYSNLDVLGVSPPMNSVVVEKHHPVTQQTISQATAAKYPRTLHQFSNAISVRPPGHSGKTHTQTHSNIQSIKVVD
uniref:Centrosomal protein POC5 n=1 Tax=Varanus komodoensis TaxID=61221 RepID=A0A8D2ISP5_VARKO